MPVSTAAPAMLAQSSDLDKDLRDLAGRPADEALRERLAGHGLELLPALEPYLASDLPIAVLEGYEAVLKAVLRRALAGEVSGPAARAIAAFQLRVGLLLKYKSYAIKASSPLGYSIFLQNPGEGFSFQRHVTHKTEVFHILDVHPGGFVFLAAFDEWVRSYDRERFAAWLAGERREPDYDRCRFEAHPGDVFVLDRLGIVHTVVGCVLEEFATISTDLVERLHDQNEGKPIPAAFDRAHARERLLAIRTPPASRRVSGPKRDPRIEALPPRDIPGGSQTVLAEGFVAATRYRIEPRGSTEPQSDPRRAASLYVRAGQGRVLLGTAAELARATPPSLPVAANDLLTVPHGIDYAFVNEGGAPLELVEHKIRPEVAFHEAPSAPSGRSGPSGRRRQ
jgi:mannose-6-phosphate isomerase-like protein (cupin superfamily)